MTKPRARRKPEYVDVELQVGKVRMKARVTDRKCRDLLRQVFQRLLALGALEADV